ncbi:MAG: hypothetical protein COS42_00555, partial [Flavobacteriales bacterium CG03_land_8_20_14_0_80_35_15]
THELIATLQCLRMISRCSFIILFKVQGSRFKVQGSKFKVQSSRFKVQGLKFKVQGLRFKVYLYFVPLNSEFFK